MAIPEERTFSNDTRLQSIKWPGGCREPRLDFVDTQEAGLRFRITPKGKRTFVYRYFPNGSKTGKQVTLGTYPAYTLKEAREQVRQLRKSRESGIDPKVALADQKRAAAEAATPAEGRSAHYTVNALCREWLDDVQNTKSNNTYKQYKHVVENWIKPELGTIAVANVGRDDIANMRQAILSKRHRKTGKPLNTLANRLQAITRAMFNWCIENRSQKSGIELNPVNGRQKWGGKENPLRLTLPPLTIDAVAKIIYYARESKASDAIRLCIELCWRIGLRPTEARTAKKGDFDLKANIWTIPKTKNGIPLRVMLPSQVAKIIKNYLDTHKFNKSDSIFRKSRGTGPMDAKRIQKVMTALHDNELYGGKMHISRHAFMSWAKANKIGLDVRNRLTNHVDRSIDATYSHADLDDEAREAWHRYSNEIEREIKKLQKNSPKKR
ncbi:MAG: integrase [Halieaceae bacterium]|jgi:integrase